MLNEIEIKNFKSIRSEKFELKPLTFFTGSNSIGKSSVLQTILLNAYVNKENQLLKPAVDFLFDYEKIRNYYLRDKDSRIGFIFDNNKVELMCDADNDWRFIGGDSNLIFEENLYYLWSNRIGQEDIVKINQKAKFDIDGKYAFSYFYRTSNFISDKVDEWLKKILDIDLRLYVEPQGDYVNVSFKNINKTFSTFNVGAGVSYITKILIIALCLKPNDIFMIENPEIHLHPKAISNLASFFAEIVSKNKVQLIVETHSEYFLHKLRYEIYKKKFNADDVRFFYKDDPNKEFEMIDINENGHLVNFKKEKINFPTGFLDVSLNELLEIM